MLLFIFTTILPGVIFFTACKKNNNNNNNNNKGAVKVTNLSVELVNNDYVLNNGTITISYGGKVELNADDFKVTATLSDGKTKIIEEKQDNIDGYSFESNLPNGDITEIDEYKITFSHSDLNKNVEIIVNVVKAIVDMSNVEWNYSKAFTYDGTIKSVALVNVPNGVNVSYSNAQAINAATYTAVANFTHTDSEHYEDIPNKTLTWNIEKADIILPTIEFKTLIYNGTEQNAEIKSDIIEALENRNIAATISGITKATDAGTYNVEISFVYDGEDADNYNPIEPIVTRYTILPKEVDCSSLAWSDVIEYKYDGNVFKPEMKNIPSGVVANYKYTTKQGVEVKEPKDIGEYIAYVEIVKASNNYTLIKLPVLNPLNFSILENSSTDEDDENEDNTSFEINSITIRLETMDLVYSGDVEDNIQYQDGSFVAYIGQEYYGSEVLQILLLEIDATGEIIAYDMGSQNEIEIIEGYAEDIELVSCDDGYYFGILINNSVNIYLFCE